jgi:hypothetical protein
MEEIKTVTSFGITNIETIFNPKRLFGSKNLTDASNEI